MISSPYRSRAADEQFSYRVLCFYFFYEYIRPQEIFGFLKFLNIGFFVSALLLFICIKSSPRSVTTQPIAKYSLVFLLLIGFSVLYAINTFTVFNTFKTMSLTYVCGILALSLIVNTHERLMHFFGFWVVLQTGFALFVIYYGGRGTGSFLSDENDAGLALNMSIPFIFYLYRLANKPTHKIALVFALLTVLTAVVATASRGTFVGFVAVVAGIWWLSEKRIRNLLLAMIFVVSAVPLIINFLPDVYVADVASIGDKENSTRVERIVSWEIGLQMFYDNPVLGVGAGNYPWQVQHYQDISNLWSPHEMRTLAGRQAHSIYFTLIPELGLLGTIIFLLVVYHCYQAAHGLERKSSKQTSAGSGLQAIVQFRKACLVSMLAFLISGAFISTLYYPNFWFLCGFFLVLKQAYEREDVALDKLEPHRSHRNVVLR